MSDLTWDVSGIWIGIECDRHLTWHGMRAMSYSTWNASVVWLDMDVSYVWLDTGCEQRLTRYGMGQCLTTRDMIRWPFWRHGMLAISDDTGYGQCLTDSIWDVSNILGHGMWAMSDSIWDGTMSDNTWCEQCLTTRHVSNIWWHGMLAMSDWLNMGRENCLRARNVSNVSHNIRQWCCLTRRQWPLSE